MCSLFEKYEKDIEKLCIENGIDFEKAKMLPRCYGKNDIWLQYHDPNKGKKGLLDETPAPIVLKILIDNCKVRLEKNELTEKYIGNGISEITYKSICTKLGFDPLVNPPKIHFKGHEDDSEESPYAILTFEEIKYLCDYVEKQHSNSQTND